MSRYWRVAACFLILVFASPLFAQSSEWKDPSHPRIHFIAVEKGVKLEVLDWGGSGKPIVLLAGWGSTAHVFDDFAPKLRSLTHLHVYAITRRGFGASGYKPTSDPADRLGEDVLAVIDSLKLKKPILAGHSLAGAEMSWIASSHPDRIAGLIYLEAGYSYAFDDGHGASILQIMALHLPQSPPPDATDLASFGALDRYYERVNGFQIPEAELRQERKATPTGAVGPERNFPGGSMLTTLITHPRKYSRIPVPALFIFANPHSLGTWVDNNPEPKVRAAAKACSTVLSALTQKQENAVKAGVPTAHVVTIPHANHYVFLSNQGAVLEEMHAFISTLP